MKELRRTINIAALALALGWLALIATTLAPEPDDFKEYWRAAVDLRQTGDPYASQPSPAAVRRAVESGGYILVKFLYPPPFAYLMQPFALLEQRTAQLAWFGLNSALLGVLIWTCIGVSGSAVARRYWGVVTLACLIAPPTRLSLQLGQVSVTLALAAVAGAALARRSPPASGVLLALSGAVKFYHGLLGLYYLQRRQWRVLGWAALGALLAFAASLPLYGLGPYRSYIEKVLRSGHYPYAAEHNISLLGFWERLLTRSDYALPLADMPLLARALAALTGVAVLALCWWYGRPDHEELPTGAALEAGELLRFGVWLCGMLLLSPSNGYYNLVLLLLPCLAVVRYLEERPDRAVRNWLLLGTALVCWPPAWSNGLPALYQALHVGWGVLLLTPALYGLCIYLGLLVLLARRGAAAPARALGAQPAAFSEEVAS
jgi:hypothetical protein